MSSVFSLGFCFDINVGRRSISLILLPSMSVFVSSVSRTERKMPGQEKGLKKGHASSDQTRQTVSEEPLRFIYDWLLLNYIVKEQDENFHRSAPTRSFSFSFLLHCLIEYNVSEQFNYPDILSQRRELFTPLLNLKSHIVFQTNESLFGFWSSSFCVWCE